MNKRTLAALLAVLMVVGAAVAFAQTRFPDVRADHPQAEDIAFVAEKGWFVGRSNGSFSPGAKITPAQMTKVLTRAFPDGMSRAHFASFIRGGEWWKNHKEVAVQDWPRSTRWQGEVGPGSGRVLPGVYKFTGDFEHCYWERQRDFRGQGVASILANENIFNETQFIVEILETDAGFKVTCR